MTALTLVIFGAVIALGRLAPRFWCRYLCPLGALLSLVSPLGLFRRRVSAECNRCMACQKACPMGAIAGRPARHPCAGMHPVPEVRRGLPAEGDLLSRLPSRDGRVFPLRSLAPGGSSPRWAGG